MILFYAHWEIRVNYLRIYPQMRNKPTINLSLRQNRYSSFVASVNCLVAVYFTPMSCLNSTSVLLSVTFRGYALIIRIQVTSISSIAFGKYWRNKPYSSWERGQNENANGLLRQYFPKAMELIFEELLAKVL